MAKKDYDFSGWATRNNLKCSDGRVIMKDAFKDNNGARVPLVWGHIHDDPNRVLGHADLENRNEGVYAYCKFNDTDNGRTAKLLVEHGDVNALSICANQLKQNLSNVVHGNIREVSLVLAGANPGAFIDSVMTHGDDDESDEEAVIYTGETIELHHSDKEEEEDDDEKGEKTEMREDEWSVRNKTVDTKATDDDKTVKEVFDTLNEEQKTVVYALIGQILEENGIDIDDEDEDDKKGGKSDMKHNAFEDDEMENDGVLTHGDQIDILTMAKQPGMTFQTALNEYVDDNDIAHGDALSSGFAQDGADGNVSWLFPEYRNVRPGAPELVTNDQGWVSVVLSKVHKSPISRIRTSQVDIRNIEGQMDDLRARGYDKGKEKKLAGNFKLARRETDPQTIYVKSALHRDDIIDITDFDYVQYLYNIDRMQLNEELATAIMIGDGREEGEDKIDETHIRPIWKDDDLYTLHVDIDFKKVREELQGTGTGTSFGENFIKSEAMINAVLYAREKYKGSGTPDMFITPHMLNVMLLARDMNGRRLYSSVNELASSFNVGTIYTAEQFEGKERTDKSTNKHKLVAIICNLSDYSLGATKGGEITHFTQFDIDFNQQKSLLETRCSGALTRIYSAIAIEEPVGEP